MKKVPNLVRLENETRGRCGFCFLGVECMYKLQLFSSQSCPTLMNSLHFPCISLVMLDFLVFFIFWHTCKNSIVQHQHHHYSSGATLQLISSSKVQSSIQWNNGGIMSFFFWDVLQNKISTKAKCCHNIVAFWVTNPCRITRKEFLMKQTKMYVCTLEEFILVDIWIHCCASWNCTVLYCTRSWTE